MDFAPPFAQTPPARGRTLMWAVAVMVLVALGFFIYMKWSQKSAPSQEDETVREVVRDELLKIQQGLEQRYSYAPPEMMNPPHEAAPPPVPPRGPPPPPQAAPPPPVPPSLPPLFDNGGPTATTLSKPDPPMRFGDDVPVTADRNSL